MATRFKGWTSRLPVKLLCVALVMAMVFTLLLGVLGLVQMNLNSIDEGFIFTDFNDSDYFFDQYAPLAQWNLETVFGYQSEENIRNMGCLAWEREDAYGTTETVIYGSGVDSGSLQIDLPESSGVWMRLVSKNLINRQSSWGSARFSYLNSPAANELLNGAINNQIDEFRRAKYQLETMPELYYYITDGERVLTNAPDKDADFYRSQPVYIIEQEDAEGTSIFEQSRDNTHARNYAGYPGYNYYIAFSQDAVNYQNSVWRGVQRQLIINLAIIAGSAIVVLFALIILVSGAGRRYADGGKAVHFTPLDKPWLDISLYIVIGTEIAFCAFIYFAATTAWRYGNTRAVLLLMVLLSAGFVKPVLWWVLTFAKRCKAGKWWRHTMLYWIWSKLVGFIKSLWSGFPLTVRVVGIALVFLVAMAFTVPMSPEAAAPACGIISVIAAVLMLRYANKLHKVEQGAKAVGAGMYETIAVTGGELGRIADSINSISGGINAAVAERMKSERLKTELITNVSHDIRTPLTSLITYTDLLKNEGLDSERAPEYLDVLIQKSARLKTLTDDLFEASKAASGNIEVNLDTLDLSDLVKQVLGELDERVTDSGLDFRMNLPERAPVSADGKLMWRVMENLLSNVFKYALKGSRVYIDVTPEDEGYRLDVKNISENPLNVDPAELTERFKRGDGARSGDGSGLGLSIAQSFVQAQGGRFTLAIDGDLFKATVYLPKA